MARVTVPLRGRSYPIVVGHGALQELARLVKEMGVTSAAIVTDEVVAPLWADAVALGLSGAGIVNTAVVVPPGEPAKSFAWLERILTAFERAGLDRSGAVLALGGGAVGDVAGFAAAVWLRGVRCVQVPTTLLAMVDSSIGGKTGINTARAKNAVGAYWQPSLVIADLGTLSTLPESTYLDAFSEIVKYAVAMDAELFKQLGDQADSLRRRDGPALEQVVARCAELKARVVGADERDQGPRAVLNYGHTVGHALEAASAYTLSHGRAVAFGMRVAARIAARAELCHASLGELQEKLLAAFDLPGVPPAVAPGAVLDALPRDKKTVGGTVRWVLPREIGRADVGCRVPQELVEEELAWLLAS